VRLDGVRELRVTSDGHLVADLTCGASIPVSRRRRHAFVVALKGGDR
jgi:DNA-binding LytR/AlgR family response regulator